MTTTSTRFDGMPRTIRTYARCIAIGAIAMLALDALGHFYDRKPYADFPWRHLRMGMTYGVIAATIGVIIRKYELYELLP